jgi:hypothetical protein
MYKDILKCAALLIFTGTALAQAPAERAVAAPDQPAAEPPAQPPEGGTKELAGMSILGNQEAPKSLVIVPWKSSEIGAGIGVSRALDPSIRPVDKDVFMRELRYYEIRTGGGN